MVHRHIYQHIAPTQLDNSTTNENVMWCPTLILVELIGDVIALLVPAAHSSKTRNILHGNLAVIIPNNAQCKAL